MYASNSVLGKQLCVPVGSGVLVSNSVAPGHQAQAEGHTGSSREEQHTQTQQQRQERGEQSAGRTQGKIKGFFHFR